MARAIANAILFNVRCAYPAPPFCFETPLYFDLAPLLAFFKACIFVFCVCFFLLFVFVERVSGRVGEREKVGVS
jgi:hypothetical protein